MSTDAPLGAGDVVLGMLVGLFLFTIAAVTAQRSIESRVFVAAALVKVVASIAYAIYVVDIFAGGDSLLYHNLGVYFGDIIRSDLGTGSFDSFLAAAIWMPGRPATSNFVGLSAILHIFCLNSFLASSLVLAAGAFLGQVLLYRTFVRLYPDPRLRRWWQLGMLFFPSLTFWSSGLLKDSLGILGLGCLVWGIVHFLQRPRVRPLIVALFGGYTLLVFRGQVLLPMVVAILPLLWLSANRQQLSGTRRAARRPVPWRWIIVACAPLLFLMLGRVSSKYSLAELPVQLSYKNDVYATQRGPQGQSISNAVDQITYEASWSGLIRAAPQAVLYAIARPFPWEARGMVAILAALENMVLDYLIIWSGVMAFRQREVFRRTVRTPVFWACVIFVVLFAIGVGVATPNVGTLNRYRIPMIPFLIAAAAIVRLHSLQIEGAKEQKLAGDRLLRGSSSGEPGVRGALRRA